MADKPLIQDFSANTFENPEKKAEIAEQNKEDELLRSKAKGNTESMNNSFMDGFNMTKFNETDMDTVNLALKLEAEDRKNESLGIGFDDIGDALNTDEMDLTSISYKTKGKTVDSGENSFEGDNNEVDISSEGENIVMSPEGEKTTEINEKEIKSIKLRFPELKEETFIPFIEGLTIAGELTTEVYNQILNNFVEYKEFHFEGIDISPEVEQKLLDGIKLINSAKNNESKGGREEYFQDFPELKTDAENSNVLTIINEVNSIIGRNYIELSDDKSEKSLELNKCTAIEEACENLLSTHKNINRSTVTFDRSMRDIKIGANSEKKFEGLLSLYTQIGTDEGSLGARGNKLSLVMRQGKEKRMEILQKQFAENMASINNNTIDGEEREQLINEKELIIAEANEIENGEVFNAGENDVLNNNLSEGSEVA